MTKSSKKGIETTIANPCKKSMDEDQNLDNVAFSIKIDSNSNSFDF